MSWILGSQSGKVVSGYYGPFTFLNNQRVFDDTFGIDPVILALKPLVKAEAVMREQVEEFIDSCKLDVFLASHRNYYVGVGNKEWEVQATNAACETISELRMEYKVNNRMMCYLVNSWRLHLFYQMMRRNGLRSYAQRI